ncbi:hypothetical protein [Psychrobacillus faecigallinarum]|nr:MULTISPECIES: hypothetical protein [Psychrobacillus]
MMDNISDIVDLPHCDDSAKNHVFNNSHIKDGGVGRSNPDFELAQVWQRLIYGKQVDSDIQLLHDEIFESKFESIFQIMIEQLRTNNKIWKAIELGEKQ